MNFIPNLIFLLFVIIRCIFCPVNSLRCIERFACLRTRCVSYTVKFGQ